MFAYMRRGPGFYRQVVTLAAPIVLQNLVTNTLAMADTFMVGLLGELPMAAVTLANIPLFVVQLFIFGVQSGGSVLFSQYWGKQDRQSINRVIGVSLWFVLLISSVFAVILLVCPVEFLSLFGNEPEVIALAAQYGSIAGLSYVVTSVTMVYIAAFRSMERPQLGMYILGASMLTNTFLNWVLIFGNLGAPALGVRGAAIATLTARILEVGIVVVHSRKTRYFRVEPALLLRPGVDMVRRFFRYGGMVICNETMWGVGTSVFPTIMGHMEHSTEILAAYTIAGNVEKIFMVVAFGLASTAAILVGRDVGAGRTKDILGLGMTLDTLAVMTGIVVGSVLLAFNFFIAPKWVFPLFKLSPGAVEASMIMIGIIGCTMPLRDFNNVNIVGVLRGGGDVQMATMIDLGPLWLAAVPFAAICGLVLKTGIFWVYMAFTLDYGIKFFLGIHRLRSGRWVRDLTRA